jgi:hypothetical protein
MEAYRSLSVKPVALNDNVCTQVVMTASGRPLFLSFSNKNSTLADLLTIVTEFAMLPAIGLSPTALCPSQQYDINVEVDRYGRKAALHYGNPGYSGAARRLRDIR